MKQRVIALAACAASLALAPLSVSARPGDSMMEKHHQKMIEELKLNADQKEKLKALHQEMRDKGKALFEKMKAIREKVKAELLKDKPSQQALDEFAAQLADLHKQLIQQRHAHLLQAKAILTKEQFSKLLSRDWAPPPDRMRGKMGRGPHEHGPCPEDEGM